jgi:hypothetical protein
MKKVFFKYVFKSSILLKEFWRKMTRLNLTHEAIYLRLEGLCKALRLTKYDVHKIRAYFYE